MKGALVPGAGGEVCFRRGEARAPCGAAPHPNPLPQAGEGDPALISTQPITRIFRGDAPPSPEKAGCMRSASIPRGLRRACRAHRARLQGSYVRSPGRRPSLFPKPSPELLPNTYAYESQPMVKPTGFREYDARWLIEKEINLMGVQAL